MQLLEKDLFQLKSRNIVPDYFLENTNRILKKIKATKIEKPCTLGDGIEVLSPMDCLKYNQTFDARKNKKATIFIPASGAATRMFKHISAIHSFEMDQLAEEFIIHFKNFPFFPSLEIKFNALGHNIHDMINHDQWHEIIRIMCNDISFIQLPKALIPFHNFESHQVSALFEQVREGLTYAKNLQSPCTFHFTISPEITVEYEIEVTKILDHFGHDNLQISYSYQSPKTDTPALKNDGGLARDKDDKIIFRPAGHGALLENLQQIDSDIIFIKNIDNVSHHRWTQEITFYKKVLAGYLLDIVAESHQLLLELERNNEQILEAVRDFLFRHFGYQLSEELTIGKAYDLLYRPIRVCGMVKNEGEPGGGPFWVMQSNGYISKQIVEKNQIDTADPIQIQCLAHSTHFNPVDIVCCINDHNGKKYNLKHYVDESASFISDKFQEGQIVKALELPGLWNGSMAGWNSIFIEVPNSTFHPVKTVNDLLRPGHQG
jgi:hypothetical protein